MTTRPNPILIHRHGSLGDTIVALPALHVIAEAFPDRHRLLLTKRRTHSKAPQPSEILDGSGLVDGYIEYSDSTNSFALRKRILKEHPDALICLVSPPLRRKHYRFVRALRAHLFWRMCGIKRVIGQPARAVEWEPRLLADGYRESRAEYLLRRVRPLLKGSVDYVNAYDLRLSEYECSQSEAFLRSVVGKNIFAISVGTKTAVNDWGDARWAPFLRNLALAYPDFGLVAVGSADESARCETLCADWKGRFINLCGRTSVRVTGAVLARSSAFIGHDSGPMHLAAAVGTRCVAMFSTRNSPGEWFPCGVGHEVLYHRGGQCEGCKTLSCEEAHKEAIRSITVDEVMRSVEKIVGSDSN